MSEDDFSQAILNSLVDRDAPIVTGDPVIDEMERKIWEMGSGSRTS